MVKERWDSASHAGVSWAGQELPAVQIDKFGKFAYVLVKLTDRLAGSKLLVRGKNGRTEQQLVSAVSKEVSHIYLCPASCACAIHRSSRLMFSGYINTLA